MLAAWGYLAIRLLMRLGRARTEAEGTARTDSLTNLPNRRGMEDALETAAALAERHRIPLTALMVDIDSFKQINDTHGHDAGDSVVRAIAAALGAATRDVDVAGRWGGDEFLVILPYADQVSGAIVAERIRAQIASSSLTNRGATVSIGVAALRDGDAARMLRDADDALYVAKATGRDRVVVSPELPVDAFEGAADAPAAGDIGGGPVLRALV
jgi:diguanylate cyclase (GGDEF)-like protein